MPVQSLRRIHAPAFAVYSPRLSTYTCVYMHRPPTYARSVPAVYTHQPSPYTRQGYRRILAKAIDVYLPRPPTHARSVPRRIHAPAFAVYSPRLSTYTCQGYRRIHASAPDICPFSPRRIHAPAFAVYSPRLSTYTCLGPRHMPVQSHTVNTHQPSPYTRQGYRRIPATAIDVYPPRPSTYARLGPRRMPVQSPPYISCIPVTVHLIKILFDRRLFFHNPQPGIATLSSSPAGARVLAGPVLGPTATATPDHTLTRGQVTRTAASLTDGTELP